MSTSEPILVAKNKRSDFFLLPQMANRHGLIAGATGTGKTTLIRTIAGQLNPLSGSLSLDVSSDRSVLYVHSMYAPDPETERRQIKNGLERRVIRLLRGIERE